MALTPYVFIIFKEINMDIFISIITFFNFITFLYILIGIDINYSDHACKKKAYTFFFSVFILMVFTMIVPFNLSLLTNLLELLSILLLIFIYNFKKEISFKKKKNQTMFVLFFFTQCIYIVLNYLI
jgi:hypothetical protein